MMGIGDPKDKEIDRGSFRNSCKSFRTSKTPENVELQFAIVTQLLKNGSKQQCKS
jgi:hypothetical protein